MYEHAKLSIGTIGFGSWTEAFRAARAMPAVFLWSAILMLLMSALAAWIEPGVSGWQGLALSTVSVVVHALVATPIAIATHRFVLRAEADKRFRFAVGEARFQRFFLFALVWAALLHVPGLLGFLGYLAPQAFAALGECRIAGLQVGLIAGSLALALAGLIVAVSSLMLFPAVAADAPGATWSNAFADMRGHGFKVLLIMVTATLPLLPFILVFGGGLVVLSIVLGLAPNSVPERLLMVPLDAGSMIMCVPVYAAAASRIYAALGRRLNGGAGASTQAQAATV